jgi:hypothetical protein
MVAALVPRGPRDLLAAAEMKILCDGTAPCRARGTYNGIQLITRPSYFKGKAMQKQFLVSMVLILLVTTQATAEEKRPLQVFVLAGQSNMQGHGALKTIDWLGKDSKYGSLL